MENEIFRKGAMEDLADKVAKELKRPGQTIEEANEEVLQFMESQLASGKNEDDVVMDLSELWSSDRSKQSAKLQELRQKMQPLSKSETMGPESMAN